MVRSRPLSLALGLVVTGCATSTSVGPGSSPAATPSTGARVNPLLTASTLQYQAPPFDKIRETDYQPAIEEGMRQHLAEVEAIANQTAAPTFDNTIVAMERSGALLTRASKIFFALTQSNTNDTLQAVQTAEAPKLAAHSDAIYLDPKLFARVKSLYDRRDALGLDAEQKFLVERYYRDFVRAGALLSEADKTRLRALNQEESKLTTDFQNKLLAATKAGAVVVADRAELAGLSDGEIAAAAEAAKLRNMDGKWVLPLQNTTQQPAQAELQDRALRERLFQASTLRADHGDTNDTKAVIRRLAQLRAERAKLLGFPTYAAYKLDDQMAKTPDAAIKLLSDLVPPATRKARSEQAKMQQLVDKEHGGFQLAPWDWQYYSERVRQAEYDLDQSQIKPYFELDRVLHDGVFYAANQLYGLTFKERKDIPVYQPDVRVFEVFDADGKSLAFFYCDYFKRDNKSGGAWMDSFVDQSGLLGTKPVVFNVANFTKPAPGQPALLTFDDVTTMFHEFGHALHGMFASQEYPTLSGTSVARDFVEFPSQFNENWALDPKILPHYAVHYQTGQTIPQDLVSKILKARTFNQGYEVGEALEAARLDLDWHSLPATAPRQDVDKFEADALAKGGFDTADVPPRYRSSYFLHIWSNGYSGSYYAYAWTRMLGQDAFNTFESRGGLTRENGQRFRDMVLSRGNTLDLAEMYRGWAGHDPQIQPYLDYYGLNGGAAGPVAPVPTPMPATQPVPGKPERGE